MPETGEAAVNWCLTKLIKGMGDAKPITVRLACVPHQEKLCLLNADYRCLYVFYLELP